MKIKYLLVCIGLLAPVSLLFGQFDKDSLLKELGKAIDSSHHYDAQKFERIREIKRIFEISRDKQLSAQYDFYSSLYEEYKIFKFDTAFLYVKKIEDIAAKLNDPSKITASTIKLAFVLLSAGMYKEADEIMNKINIQGQPDSLKAEYYLARGRFYYDLADYNNDEFFYPGYFKKAGEYLDSSLLIFPVSSFEHVYYSGLKAMKIGQLDKAFNDFHAVIKRPGLTDHQLALAASTLSYIYFRKGKTDTAVSYQIRAAIADIKSSTKETFAVLNLAQILFDQGDFSRASLYIKKAIDDATSYGARQRKIQVSTIMPIIQSSEISYVKRQRKLWIIYAVIVSAVLILLGFLLVIIRRQNIKLRQAKKEISDAHTKLHEVNSKLTTLNDELQVANSNLVDVNTRLEEANKIKEEYVGYFFTLDAEFFQKIERFKKAIEEKIHYGKFSEIKYILNGINIRDEKEELVKSFDKAFLKLFPHFVDEFNALFDEENKVKLQDGELLNTDLRIYALLRLGIKENEKIAEILQYSVKSIYAYKTKIRNRSNLSKDEFDKKMMEFKSI